MRNCLIYFVAPLSAALIIVLLYLLTNDYDITNNPYIFYSVFTLIGGSIALFYLSWYPRIVQERFENELAVKENVFIQDIRESYGQFVKGSEKISEKMDKFQPDLITGTDMTFLYHPFRVAVKNNVANYCISETLVQNKKLY